MEVVWRGVSTKEISFYFFPATAHQSMLSSIRSMLAGSTCAACAGDACAYCDWLAISSCEDTGGKLWSRFGVTTARCGENGGNVVRIGAKWLVVGGGKLEMGGICGARKKLVEDDVIMEEGVPWNEVIRQQNYLVYFCIKISIKLVWKTETRSHIRVNPKTYVIWWKVKKFEKEC